MSSRRDPYPYPRLENDTNFVKADQLVKSDQSPQGTKLEPSPEKPAPWSRLHDTATLNSLRRHVNYYDPLVPRDTIDFVLKCQYNHSDEFNKSKAETLLQPETVTSDHGRVLKNRPVVRRPPTLEEQELVEFQDPRKVTLNSAKGLAIQSHHSEATNRGYSRKGDGGFYST